MTDSNVQQTEICPNCRRPVLKHRPWCAMFEITGEAPKVGDVVEYPGLGPVPLVSVYLRADAISDGELIDCTQDPFDDLNRNAGLLFDVAITRAVFERYVEVPEEFKGQQDILGRYWDIVFMFRLAASRSRQIEVDTILFEFVCIPNGNDYWANERPAESPTHRTVILKAVVFGGDRGEPCLNFMLPGED